ncbi:MAG: VacB/RNase II family 3'-5' exoribonuclease [Cellvibrionaceae bacterium]
MLTSDVLSQLSTLKKEIRANTDTAQGTVRGTAGRYGFVSLDDGRDAFLNPEQMDRLFHGDRIEVAVTQNEKEQFEAKVEKLIHSPLKQVAGRYCVKGKGHFVIYETQQHSRWIFVPPKARSNAKDGNYVTARITQHPYESGKAQARITSDIGKETNADTARQFTLAMFQLFDNFPKDVQEQAQTLQKQAFDEKSNAKRSDLRHLPFVTIDSTNTKDMDDALTIITTEDGWELTVAIADPSSEINIDSPLDNIAQRRGQTIYLPGKSVPMLPESLSLERYSLLSGQDRPALACKLTINSAGKVSNYLFESAIISSKAKLSYQQVSALLNGKTYQAAPQLDDIEPFKEQLVALKNCANALKQYRQKNQLVTENKSDYILIVNEEGKLASIEKIDRTDAHIIVEESMIATNQSAGHLLAQHNPSKTKAGLFSAHPGYREERREDIEKLLKEALGEDYIGDNNKLENYVKTIRLLQSDSKHERIFSIQQRFHQGSEPSSTPSPHFGLGAEYYATITSPIRRYQDLYNQRVIHKILEEKKPTNLRNKQIDRLKESIANSRNASRLMEQWLIADYMQDKIGQTFTAYIALLTNQGIGIRLRDNDIEGFIVGIKEDKENPEAPFDKISFNNQRMELTWNETALFLDQDVEVKLTTVDMDKRKLVFDWVNRP